MTACTRPWHTDGRVAELLDYCPRCGERGDGKTSLAYLPTRALRGGITVRRFDGHDEGEKRFIFIGSQLSTIHCSIGGAPCVLTLDDLHRWEVISTARTKKREGETMSQRFHDLVIRRQPEESYPCQACCVATLVGCSLEEVLAEVTLTTDKVGRQYLTNDESCRWMVTRGLCFGAIGNWPDFTTLDVSEGLSFERVDLIPALVGVKSRWVPDLHHAVVWDPERRMVLDPRESDPQPLTDYLVYEWWPVFELKQQVEQ